MALEQKVFDVQAVCSFFRILFVTQLINDSIQENDSLNGFIQKLRSMPIPKVKRS
jgi:hypothetical protein